MQENLGLCYVTGMSQKLGRKSVGRPVREVWPENCFAAEELRGFATSLRCLCWICLAEECHPESFRAKKACPGLFGFGSVHRVFFCFVVLTPTVEVGNCPKEWRHPTNQDLRCRRCARSNLTLRAFPPSLVKEVIFTRVRDKHKQIKIDNTWNVHAFCADCTFQKCVVCRQRKPNPDTGRPRQCAQTWLCASCHDTNLVCVTCGHSDSPTALAWDVSTGRSAGQPDCWRCVLKQKKPAVWTKFTNLCCYTCQTSDLTLHAFQPALAKEIFWNPKFSWSRRKPSCLSCTQKPALTCSLCAVTSPGIDFVSPDGMLPVCYRCFFQRDHGTRFATFAGLTCPGCQQTDLTLTAFPPAVARKILTVRTFRLSRANEFCSRCASSST